MRMMNPKPIGHLIREWRVERKRWSLLKLEEESGVRNQTINAIETGASQNPQLKTVKPITDALGIPWTKVVACITEDAATFGAKTTRKVAAG